MKRVIVCIILVFGLAGSAVASQYIFDPPTKMDTLDHSYYFTWGINQTLPPGETITDATFFIGDLNNWIIEDNDILYVHLLGISDYAPLGVHSGYDAQGGGDKFNTPGWPLLFTYSDDNEYQESYEVCVKWNPHGKCTKSETRYRWINPSEDILYHFTKDQLDDLNLALLNGNFGFGLDPECHFNDSGIRFVFNTTQPTTVPEPSTFLLLGVGCAGVGLLRRRFKT